MTRNLCTAIAASALLIAISAAGPASAQKQGGILKTYDSDSPGGMSIMEEATIAARGPMNGVFNNLIMFDQHVPQNSLQSIVPDLATSWAWSEEGTELTFQLRRGVSFHDGKPFTARDVKCTWDLRMDLAPEKLRINPGKSGFYNLAEVTTNGRLGGHFSSEAAAAVVSDADRGRLVGDLSLPRIAGRDAEASDRHRPVQICRVQAE
jgi:peptide/nickel transport system substrate-binding protein